MKYNFIEKSLVKPINKKHVLKEKKINSSKSKFIINVSDKDDLIIIDLEVLFDSNSKIISKSNVRCDYLVIQKSSHTPHFIELKGCDINHALEQIENSVDVINDTSNSFIHKKFDKKYAYIILSRTPKVLPQAKIASLRKHKNISVEHANYEIEKNF